MSFYSEIYPYIEYLISIRKLETYLSFDLQFPSKWSIPKSMLDEGSVVTFDINNQNLKGISFVSKIDDEQITNVINKIVKVINLNKEKELKEKLFKETIDNLKMAFESNSLEKLQNLYFDFDEKTNLNIVETDEQFETKSNDDELVGGPEEKGRDGNPQLQERNYKRNKKHQKGEYISET
jgi:hypothetical protein